MDNKRKTDILDDFKIKDVKPNNTVVENSEIEKLEFEDANLELDGKIDADVSASGTVENSSSDIGDQGHTESMSSASTNSSQVSNSDTLIENDSNGQSFENSDDFSETDDDLDDVEDLNQDDSDQHNLEQGDSDQDDSNNREKKDDNDSSNNNQENKKEETGKKEDGNEEPNQPNSSQEEAKDTTDKSDDLQDNKKDEMDSDNRSNSDDKQPKEQKHDDLKDKKNNSDSSKGDQTGKKNDAQSNTNKASSENKAPKENIGGKNPGAKESGASKPGGGSQGPASHSNPKQFAKDKFNNSNAGKSFNNAKNFAKNPKQGLQNMAQNKFNNSKLGQGIQKGKDAVDKAKKTAKAAKNAGKATAKAGKAAAKGLAKLVELFISALPWSAIAVLVILLIIVIVVLIVSFMPGVGGDSNDSNDLSNYSEKDQELLGDLHKIFKKYPGADGALAMVIVAYPYFDNIHSGNVTAFLNKYNEDENEEEEEPEDNLTEGDKTDDDDKSYDEDEENGSNHASDDFYLSVFRNRGVRNDLKRVLKKLEKSSEDEFKAWLKSTVFKYKGFMGDDEYSYSGYRGLFKNVASSDKDALMDAIIEDLYDKKDLFIHYVYSNVSCYSSSTSLGYSTAGDIIQGEPFVVIKDAASVGSIDSLKAAPSLYGTGDNPMPLGRYIMGVAYAEIGDYVVRENSAKTQMIAAKSFLLGRTQPGCDMCVGVGFTPDHVDGKTIFYIRGNVNDQAFCDVYEGCGPGHSTFNTNWSNWHGEGYGTSKPALSPENLANLEKWWNETANEYVFDETHNVFNGAYFMNYEASSYCVPGYCLSQEIALRQAANGDDYMTILFGAGGYSSCTLFNGETSSISKVTSACSGTNGGGCDIPSSEFIYYSQRDYNDPFCGRTDGGTISSSGCGVTSMAMILSNLVDSRFTPPVVMEEAHQGNYCGTGIYGTNSGFFSASASKHGLNYDYVDGNDTSENANKKIKDTLKSGGLMIVNVGAGWSTVSSGHYLVVKGITSDDKLVIADPMVYRSESGGDPLNHPFKNNITIDEMRTYTSDGAFFLFTGGKSDEIKEKYCAAGGAGYLGNPINPSDTTTDFMNASGNARCFPLYCGGTPHGAVDLSDVDCGTPVYAMDGGVVETAEYHDSWGYYVVIDHQNGYKTLYAHFSKSPMVHAGEQVEKGQQIGISGTTGNSTGCHLHLELQNTALYEANGRSAAKANVGLGLMNVAEYINKSVSYVGQTK